MTKTFRVFHPCGIVEGKSFSIIIFEFCPTEAKLYNSTISCQLNQNASNQLHFYLAGFCSEPELVLQNEGKIVFPPSYIGVYSRQKFRIQNISRVLSEYRVKVPEKYQDSLFFEPKNGTLRPNEAIYLECIFIPLKKKRFLVKVPVAVYDLEDPAQSLIGIHQPGSGNEEQLAQTSNRIKNQIEYFIEVEGSGTEGSLSVSPQVIDFGTVKVKFKEKLSAVVENISNCLFYVEFSLKPIEDTEGPIKEEDALNSFIKNCFKLDFESALIPANSKVEVGIIFSPTEKREFSLNLECLATERPIPGVTTKLQRKLISQKTTILVKGNGKYPMLKIVDIRNDTISVATLWESFHINKINQELVQDLDENEQKFIQSDSLTYEQITELLKSLKTFEWNFGYLPKKAKILPRNIIVTIKNIGETALD